MSFPSPLKSGLIVAALIATLSLASVPAQGGHQQVFINGQPVHPTVVMQIQQATGVSLHGGAYAWDGQYLYDGYGNSVPLSLGGGGYGQQSANPGGWGGGGGGGGRHTDTVIDPGGGCEGGSCVNILD